MYVKKCRCVQRWESTGNFLSRAGDRNRSEAPSVHTVWQEVKVGWGWQRRNFSMLWSHKQRIHGGRKPDPGWQIMVAKRKTVKGSE